MIAGPIEQDTVSRDHSRHASIQRLLVLIGLLSPLRFGASYRDLHRDLCEAGYSVSHRTIMRDLLVLERLGMAQKTGRSRWQWCGIGPRAAVVAMAGQERAAE